MEYRLEHGHGGIKKQWNTGWNMDMVELRSSEYRLEHGHGGIKEQWNIGWNMDMVELRSSGI